MNSRRSSYYSHRRSRSPDRDHGSYHRRSRSPPRRRHHHHSKHPRSSPILPLDSRPLTKHDYTVLEPIFSSYLSDQKSLDLFALSHREQQGRFKSFISHQCVPQSQRAAVGKMQWLMISNRGELAKGWYEQVSKRLSEPDAENDASLILTKYDKQREELSVEKWESKSGSGSESDEYGPRMPGEEKKAKGRETRLGPSAPKHEELQIQRELEEESAQRRRADLRCERKLDRMRQKEQLDELLPRAEPGTRERQLEKKREMNEKMKSFRERSPEAVEDVDDSTMMGGGEDSFAQKKAALTRKKNERELRREQILQARIAEREERMQSIREKEERTMAMLRQLASRFQ